MWKIDTGSKFKMAAAAILKIHFNGHYPVAIAHIHTEFGPETKTDVHEIEIPSLPPKSRWRPAVILVNNNIDHLLMT